MPQHTFLVKKRFFGASPFPNMLQVFEKMRALAESLTKDADDSRVEFYCISRNNIVGELTKGRASGLRKLYPESFNNFLVRLGAPMTITLGN